MDSERPDDFSHHEALHMASFLTNAVDNELCQHKAVKHYPKAEELETKAAEALAELYQFLGQQYL